MTLPRDAGVERETWRSQARANTALSRNPSITRLGTCKIVIQIQQYGTWERKTSEIQLKVKCGLHRFIVSLLLQESMYRIPMLSSVVRLPCTLYLSILTSNISALMSLTDLCKVKNAFKRGSTGFYVQHIISSTISPSITAGQRSVIHLQSDLFIFPSISRWNRGTTVHYRRGHVIL